MLGSNAVPLQLPIGAEEHFKGVVDLINWKGIVWNEHDKGMTFTEVPIPEDMIEEATEWREKLLESVAEYDEGLMEKFFDAPETITEREVLDALRGCFDAKIVPWYAVHVQKKQCKRCLIMGQLLPSPMDVEGIVGTNPNRRRKLSAIRKSHFAASA